MSNMSYCKFENTSLALQECADEIQYRTENFGDIDLGEYNPEGFEDDDEYVGQLSEHERRDLKAILQMTLAIVENAGGLDELQSAIENMAD